MNTIILNSRMGNQMFQYALYLEMKKRGIPVCIDDGSYHPGDLLRKNFGVEYKRPILRSRRWSKRIRALPSAINACGKYNKVYCDREWGYDEEVFEQRNKYLYGYWQSEKYFPDPEVKRQLREDFKCPEKCLRSDAFRSWRERIDTADSVAIHLRRTDYYHGKNNGILGGVASDQYYKNALKHVNASLTDPTFFVFSDDKDYARKFRGERDNFIVVEDDLTDLMEFFLMSACRHRIMANSSFSWWANWLKEDKSGIVCAPEIWFFKRNYEDIYTEEMIKIPIE